MQRRDRLQILHDVLHAIQLKGPKAKPTHILYKANLSYKVLQEHLNEMMRQEMIVEEVLEEKKTYSLTNKGFKFLQEYQMVREFMNSYGF